MSGRPTHDNCCQHFNADKSHIRQLRANSIQTTLLDTDSLYINGIPLSTYLEDLGINVDKTLTLLTPVDRDLTSDAQVAEKQLPSVSFAPQIVTQEIIREQPLITSNTVVNEAKHAETANIAYTAAQANTAERAERARIADCAELADRAAQANRADVANRIEDPIGAHADYVMTSDEYGRGSWHPLPSLEPSDSIQARIFQYRHKTAKKGRVLTCTDEKYGEAEWKDPRNLHDAENTFVGRHAGEALLEAKGTGINNVAVGNSAGPIDISLSNTIALGMGATPRRQGDIAIGSDIAPVQLREHASHGSLEVLGPSNYLCVTVNGAPYKLALYR